MLVGIELHSFIVVGKKCTCMNLHGTVLGNILRKWTKLDSPYLASYCRLVGCAYALATDRVSK